jgi:AraC-like DNA-binding protein
MTHLPAAAPINRRYFIDVDDDPEPIVCKATNYAAGHVIEPHKHLRGQLVYAEHGVVMLVAEGGSWIVPPTRAVWIPAGTLHNLRCIGAVRMRSVYLRPYVTPHLHAHAQAVGVSPLLRELILAAVAVVPPYAADSRDGRVMQLLLDELQALPVLPLHLPQPADPRLRRICRRLVARLDDASTLADWAAELAVDVKTIQRLFARETGMTFGQWRQQARLLHALERLALGDKVVDVAMALGYDSPSAFATMFKRQFGKTPSAFFR